MRLKVVPSPLLMLVSTTTCPSWSRLFAGAWQSGEAMMQVDTPGAMRMRAIAVGLTLFSLSACSRTHYTPADVAYHRDAWREFNKAAASFSVDDGIDRSEAKFLAWAFFNWQISGCGFPEEPQDVDTEWQARPMTGISGRPATHVIRINGAAQRRLAADEASLGLGFAADGRQLRLHSGQSRACSTRLMSLFRSCFRCP